MSAADEAAVARLRGELGARLEELNHLRRSLAAMQGASAHYARRLEAMHADRGELLHLRSRCRVLAADLHGSREDSRQQAIQVAALQAEATDLRARCAGSEHWLEAVRRSTSWRLTRPFRVLGRLFRR